MEERRPPTVVWFRRDLRLADNPALAAAAERGGAVLPVYLVDWESGSPWAPGSGRPLVAGRILDRLAADLRLLGAPLQELPGDPAAVLSEAARSVGARTVAWNTLYDPYALELDARVRAALEEAGVEAQTFPSSLLFEPEGHLSRSGKRFVQFGAFWRSCLALPDPPDPLAAPAVLAGASLTANAPGDAPSGMPSSAWRPDPLRASTTWQPGEEGARRRLATFLDEALGDYPRARDYPAVEGVSRLSPHLHFGEISPGQVWHAVREIAYGRPVEAGAGRVAQKWDRGTALDGAEAFLRQLGWREFGHYLLYHFPTISAEPFRPEFSRFPWHDDPDGLAAWREGATGFPLVDAGMRQLLAEGWMHNRVRMVVASFLAKDLLVPWQEGAAWFWDHLVDADLANNSLGWQWTAGSGPDAAPYFRVYNPGLQAERFDRGHEYVDRWLPGGPPSYAPPIVDHGMARLRALEAFREVRSR